MRDALLTVACAAATFCGSASAATIEVDGPVELRDALIAAVPGDRIALSAGDYGALDFRKKVFSRQVTIVAADRSAPPVFTSIYLSEVGGLDFDGVNVIYGATYAPLSSYAVNILKSADVTLTRMEVVSAADGVAGNDAFGVNVRDSARIAVRENRFHDVYRGVAVLDSDTVEISRNIIERVGSDGVIARGALGLDIIDNYFADFAIIDLEVQHPDAIQLWSRYALRPNENIVIRGNLIRRGVGDRSQGIFIKTPELASKNVLIEDNIVEQTMAQGIFVENGDGVVIRNNTVIPFDFATDKPGIEIRAPFANTAVNDNIAMAFRLDSGVAASGNVAATYHNPWLASFIGAHVAEPASPSRPTDFAPLGAIGARNFVTDLWPGVADDGNGSLTPPPVIADIDLSNGFVDAAPDPVQFTRQTLASGAAYYSSDASPKLSAALNLRIDARARLASAVAGWRVIAAAPTAYDIRIDRSKIRFSIWTPEGVTRLDAVNHSLLDLAAHDLALTYDGVAGSMAIAVDGVEIARRAAPTGPVNYSETQRLYIGGAPWGLEFGDGIERVKVTR